MSDQRQVAVYGAYGHTGGFVVAELARRGWRPILVGRDAARLASMGARFPGAAVRVAAVDDSRALARALGGAAAVVHCAGPFDATAAPVLAAALAARVPYLDVAAEQPAVLAAFAHANATARQAGVLAVPAMAFYGGLGDLLASALLDAGEPADEVEIAVALDRWWPTRGTRLTGERHPGPRLLFRDGALVRSDPWPSRTWHFAPPFGAQEVAGIALAESVVIPRHLRVRTVRAYLNRAPLDDLHDPTTPPPTAADPGGRSAQVFLVEVVVRRGGEARRARARGRDIYAVSAPLVVEAMERVVAGRTRLAAGVVAPGEVFAARDFLAALAPAGLEVELHEGAR